MTQPRSLIAVALRPSACASPDATPSAARTLPVAASRCVGHFGRQTHPPQFVARQRPHRLPGRNAQREFQQIDGAAHLSWCIARACRYRAGPAPGLRPNRSRRSGRRGGRRARSDGRAPAPPSAPTRCTPASSTKAHIDSQSARGERTARGSLCSSAGKIDEAADRCRKLQLSDFAPQSDCTKHGAAIGIDHHCGPGKIAAFRENKKMARCIRGNGTGGRNENLAMWIASVRGTLHPQFEMHRQRAIGSAQRCRQQQRVAPPQRAQ